MAESSVRPRVIISQGYSSEITEKLRWLFVEYQESLGINVSFQDFQDELIQLPEPFTPPEGRLIFAKSDGEFVGCIGLKKSTDKICELKRWYVRPQFRRQGTGRKLAMQAMEEARLSGYHKIQLNTLPSMKDAIRLFFNLGYRKSSAVDEDEHMPGMLHLEYSLRNRA